VRAGAAGLLLLAVLSLSGCPSGARPYIKSGFRVPGRVAVLPLNNMTNSLGGALYVRDKLTEYVRNVRGWEVADEAKVDAGLRTLAITDGGQLNASTPQKISGAVGAPVLLYTDLVDFGYTTLGFINTKKCRARIRVVDGASGELLYSAEGHGAESGTAVTGQGALEAGAGALGGQLADKAVGRPLANQVQDMLDELFEWLPR
jgi:hypothetical protein